MSLRTHAIVTNQIILSTAQPITDLCRQLNTIYINNGEPTINACISMRYQSPTDPGAYIDIYMTDSGENNYPGDIFIGMNIQVDDYLTTAMYNSVLGKPTAINADIYIDDVNILMRRLKVVNDCKDELFLTGDLFDNAIFLLKEDIPADN